ncbi:thiamine pyrophosphokinase [Parabacteroides sp. PFB2-10]|nr:thiamine pyrophosphokinase [Parabacteroides sp. PFB2-10]
MEKERNKGWMIEYSPCIVVADGLFPSLAFLPDLLREAKRVIACDGAVVTLLAHGVTPDAIVGDMDSIPEELKERFADRIHTYSEQETNDLTKAVHFAEQAGEKEVLIVGATGLREDHTLGNISLLADYGPLFDRVEILTDWGLFTPIDRTATFDSYPGQQVSIFSLTPDTKITTEGLCWPIQEKGLSSWWQGTLNEALADQFTIRLSSPGRFIVYRLFQSSQNKIKT